MQHSQCFLKHCKEICALSGALEANLLARGDRGHDQYSAFVHLLLRSRCERARSRSCVYPGCHHNSKQPHCVVSLHRAISQCIRTTPCGEMFSCSKLSSALCQEAADKGSGWALNKHHAFSRHAPRQTSLDCLDIFDPNMPAWHSSAA